MIRKTLVILFLFAAALANAQSIFTIAGGGSDDGQLATSIHIFGPRGIVFDSAGNLYFTEAYAGRLRRVDATTEIVTTIAGNGATGFSGDGGLATSATLRGPRGIAIDNAGNIYVADQENNRIRRIDGQSGIITTFAGGGPFGPIGDGGQATSAVLAGPSGVLLHGGFLYITESGFDGHRVRRVNLTTKVIETVAGSVSGEAGFSGDGGAARDAKLDTPFGIAIGPDGNLYISDFGNNRIRKIDLATMNISTYAGNGSTGDDVGDGLTAMQANINGPLGLAFDSAGNLYVGTGKDGRLRRIDRQTTIVTSPIPNIYLPVSVAIDARDNVYVSTDDNFKILKLDAGGNVTTFVGGGTFIGDGRTAVAAVLHEPLGLAVDVSGNLYIADSASTVVRRVAAATGIITTVAGRVGEYYAPPEQEGTDANTAAIGAVYDVAFDSVGDLYIAETTTGKVWRVNAAGKIFGYAGGGNPPDGRGDGLQAKDAVVRPFAIAFDSADNLYIAESDQHRVRKVERATGVITTFAGTGEEGNTGNGGKATEAKIFLPEGVAVDADGNVYIGEYGNNAIRKVDRTGMITLFAGGRDSSTPVGDDGAALDARLSPRHMEIDRARRALFFVDAETHRLRKIDLVSNVITTVAGSAEQYFEGDFAGDNGAATAAKLNFGFKIGGVAVDAAGNVFISDSANNRVRAVYACVNVGAPALTSPAAGAVNTATALTLTWSKVPGAFRYDVFLDTVNPPVRLVGSDVSETSFAVSNLQPSRTYFWSVVAKGDPFCSPVSTARSANASFTTTGECGVGAFTLTSPNDGAVNVAVPVTLSWSAAAGAGTYDVYLGTSNPPPLLAAGVTQQTLTTSAVGVGQHFWFVVAHAACDPTLTSSTTIRSFTSQLSAGCDSSQTAVVLTAPANGATNIPLTTQLSWQTAGCAVAPFDVYFGTTSDPPLIDTNVAARNQNVTSLEAATTYFWRVVATNQSGGARPTSAIFSFTTRACAAPGATSILFAPSAVSSGTTYTVVWSPATSLDGEGGYLIERSTNAEFTSGVSSQVTSSTAASFVAENPGSYYHRVRAVAGCDPTKSGPLSSVVRVNSIAARPNVIFTVQPAALVTALGERLEDKRRLFTLENIGAENLQVIVGRQELNGSAPFFSIIDPQGSDVAFLTLAPRTPRTFEIRFSGPSNQVAASYQGIIFVASTGQGLSVTPYAFVNLKIGGGTSATPQFIVNGQPAEYAVFPGLSGDDANRPPLSIGIRNPGTTPMDLAAEIGPEVWLVPDATWNATLLAPGATRTVNLTTRRSRAPNGSALPRYTYFTVRTRDGASARLLVQDNDSLTLTSGRSIRLDSSVRSFILPDAVTRISPNNRRVVTRLRLSNVGSDDVQAELIFTPASTDGFDATRVKRAVVVIPPNDVVALTDPLVQVFGVAATGSGQIEIRLPAERLGLVFVNASTITVDSGGSFAIPVVNRGEGARVGAPHVVLGVTRSATVRTSLTLAETAGTDQARVRLELFDSNGTRIGGQAFLDVPRYGHRSLDDVVSLFGGTNIEAGRIEVTVLSFAGSVIGVGAVTDAAGESGATTLSRPLNEGVTGAALSRAFWKGAAATTSVTTVVPIIGTPTSPGAAPALRTSLAFSAGLGGAANFTATFRDSSGATTVARTVQVNPGATRVYGDVVKDLFAVLSTSSGSVFIEAPAGAKVYALLQSGSSATTATFVPLPTTLSEALTSAASSGTRPLFLDGLEQSTDPTRGSRWSLTLNEMSGATGIISVRLYEAGNRSRTIGEKDFLLNPYQQLTLDTVFGALGLESEQRRKDRTNVQVVVAAIGGNARVAASAMSIDNRNGDAKVFALGPSVGSATPSISLVQPNVPQTPVVPTRRRTVRK